MMGGGGSEMDNSIGTINRKRSEAGLGLMEVIIGVFAVLILGSILVYLARLGISMYRLNNTTTGVAEELEKGRALAMTNGQTVRVFFEYKQGKFGVDRNGNGRLDNAESEELPEGVSLSENATVIFPRTGTLAQGSKEPQIIVSNSNDARSVKVSSAGAIEID
jgi:hypothetical protein